MMPLFSVILCSLSETQQFLCYPICYFFKRKSPAHKHYCATCQSTFTNHWPSAVFFIKKIYFSPHDNVIACIFVTDSAGHRVTRSGKYEMSPSASLCETAPVIKMRRHIVAIQFLVVLCLRNNMRNITHVVLEEINLGLLDEVGMIATDDFFSRCLICV